MTIFRVADCLPSRVFVERRHPERKRLDIVICNAAVPYSSLMLFRSLLLCLVCSVPIFAQNNPDWTAPFPPHKIIANVYYVGSKDLASYLITTPQGHILINSNLEVSVPSIKQNV